MLMFAFDDDPLPEGVAARKVLGYELPKWIDRWVIRRFKRDYDHEGNVIPRIRIEDAWRDFDLDTEYLRDPTKKHSMRVSEADCSRMGVPYESRDYCAHIYIPLKKCRRMTYGNPYRCKDLQMAYNRCQMNDYFRRRAMVSRRFYELYGIDDGHDHRRNFEPSQHWPPHKADHPYYDEYYHHYHTGGKKKKKRGHFHPHHVGDQDNPSHDHH